MSASPVKLFVVDPTGAATPVFVDAGTPPFTAIPVKVTLTAAVAQLCPEGWPSPPSETGVTPVAWFPQTVPSGTLMVCFANVAHALIAASAAVAA